MHLTSTEGEVRNQKTPGFWFAIAMLNLLLAALAGVVLRLAFIVELPWVEYRNLQHAHSHVALLGWGHLAIWALILTNWRSQLSKPRIFEYLFLISEIAVLGMYLTFPLFGYSGIPIFFTSVHLICSYLFIYFFLNQSRRLGGKAPAHDRFLKASFLFQILSTLGIWILPFIIAMGERHSSAYHMAVQFFLHFQFNGWLIFSCLALFLKMFQSQVSLPDSLVRKFYWLLAISTVLTYALAVTWTQPKPYIFWINSFGVLLQFFALVLFGQMLLRFDRKWSQQLAPITRVLFSCAAIAFILKILIQTAVIIPAIAVVAYTIRNFVIGFIHLFLLGMITPFLIGIACEKKWIQGNHWTAKYGGALFVAGVILTEGLLFLQGLSLWMARGFLPGYHMLIFLFSILLVVAVALLYRPRGRLRYLQMQHRRHKPKYSASH